MDPTDAYEPESSDAEPLDLSPRDRQAAPRRSRNTLAFVVLGVVAVLIVIVLVNGLSNATTYYLNVDDAIAQREEIGDRRVRLRGNVVESSIVEPSGDNTVWTFTLTEGGESIEVDLSNEPPDLFGPDIPVIVEGEFDGERFASDGAVMQHDEVYEEDEDRDEIQSTDLDELAGSST